MTRVEQIKNYAVNKANEELMEKIAEENRIIEMKEQIKALRPRMVELLDVGKACEENGIALTGESYGCHQGYDTHQFISNGWSHLTGFVKNFDVYSAMGYDEEWIHNHSMEWKKSIGGFGKIGGGACDYNLTIWFDGDDTQIKCVGDREYVLKRFLDGFDEFESEFYKYVDRITSEGEE